MAQTLARAALFLVVTLAAGCAELIKPPVVILEKVDIQEMTLKGPVMQAALRIQNPNFFPVTTTKVTYTVTIEGVATEPETITERFTVPGNGEHQLILPVKLPWAAGFGAVGAALKTGVIQTESKGVITVDALLASVDVPFVLSGRFKTSDEQGSDAPENRR